jgi:hypothetical protein
MGQNQASVNLRIEKINEINTLNNIISLRTETTIVWRDERRECRTHIALGNCQRNTNYTLREGLKGKKKEVVTKN